MYTAQKSNLKDNIQAGGGYSSDSQQVAPQLCYNATSTVSGQHGSININTAMSFSDLQTQLGIDVSASGGYGMFSADAEASYVRSVEDKDYSMSLNYYQYASATVSVELGGYGQDALVPVAKSYYNNGTNQYFRLVCGDFYIRSYEEGALLTMGIIINFSSSSEMEEFKIHAGASYADIFSASITVQDIASQYNISGSVSMQAFQVGGEPSQLAKILNKDAAGDYYILTCSLIAMGNCTKAASGLLDYAKLDFSNQFSFKNNTGLTPLGVMLQILPITYIGLVPPASFVTPQVIEDRNKLAYALKENQYYQQKLTELVYNYPVVWDPSSTVYRTLAALYQRAQINIDILMSPDSTKGAAGCFDYPDRCDDIAMSIMSKLQPITADDLKVLDAIKYMFTGPWTCNLYPTGDTDSSWDAVAISEPTGDHFKKLDAVFIRTTDCYIRFEYYVSDGVHVGCIINQGTSSDGIHYPGMQQQGNLSVCEDSHSQWSGTRQVSPYYFEAYNGTADMSGLHSDANLANQS